MSFAYIIHKLLLCEPLFASVPNYPFNRCILKFANSDTKGNISSMVFLISWVQNKFLILESESIIYSLL